MVYAEGLPASAEVPRHLLQKIFGLLQKSLGTSTELWFRSFSVFYRSCVQKFHFHECLAFLRFSTSAEGVFRVLQKSPELLQNLLQKRVFSLIQKRRRGPVELLQKFC